MFKLVVLSCVLTASAYTWVNPMTKRATQLNMATLTSVKEKSVGRFDLTSMKEINEDDDMVTSNELFLEADAEEVDPPTRGQTLTGTILEIDDNGALIAIGGKMCGYLPIKEASLLPLKSLDGIVEVGQQLTAEVIGTLRGMPVFSLRNEKLVAAWGEVAKAQEADEPFEVEVLEVNRGGAVCDAFGLTAFLPGSHFMGVPDEGLIGKKIMVKFLDVSEEEGRVVVSQRIAIAQDRTPLVRGSVVTGTVTGLRDYGAFLELENGMAGLLHISQISYDRVENLDKLFTLGQNVKVMVLDINQQKDRVALSTKSIEPNPGDMLRDMNMVFEKAEETAKLYHERLEAEKLAREAAAKEIVAGLGGALNNEGESSPDANAGGDDSLVSVAEHIESILASIVSDAPEEGK